jgi:hypothetical protein
VAVHLEGHILEKLVQVLNLKSYNRNPPKKVKKSNFINKSGIGVNLELCLKKEIGSFFN